MKQFGVWLLCCCCSIAVAQSATPIIDKQRAEFNYIMFCQGCHGPQGAGKPGNVPRVHGFMGNFLQVDGGREFLVQVPGSAYSALDNAALAELLNWMLLELSPQQTPADFNYYSAPEVGALRASALTDVDTVREKLIKAMQKQGIDVAENAQ